MRKTRIVLLGLTFLTLSLMCTPAQDTAVRSWKNRACAVSLTYDDGLNVHLDKVIPALDSLGFRGTFYLIASADGVGKRISDWRTATKSGHELGNHTLFHPCASVGKNGDRREWVSPDYDLNSYTVRRMVDEIKMTNAFLKAIDGKEKQTFAYPCGDYLVKAESYVPSIRNEFVGARSASPDSTPGTTDVFQIGAVIVDDSYSALQLIDLVKKAIDSKSLLVLCFHGVGGEHSINISLEKHNELLRFLKQNEKEIWVAPLVEIAEHITAEAQREKFSAPPR